MIRRIFIAVNLPDEVRETLFSYQRQWPDLPASWTPKDNLHITLQFVGNVSDKELQSFSKALAKVAENCSPFHGTFEKIVYGPTIKTPSMVWVLANKALLGELQKDIQKSLSQMFVVEKRPFSPHCTLAKLRQFEFQRLDPEEWPIIEEDISLTFSVQSFEIMESKSNRGRSEYTICESISLG